MSGAAPTRTPGVAPVAQLGSRLRAARLAAGLTLRELARQLQVSPSFVSQLENGKSQPSVATLYSLSQLLEVSIDVLFEPDTGDDDTEDAHDSEDDGFADSADGPRDAGEAVDASGRRSGAPHDDVEERGLFAGETAPGSVAEALHRVASQTRPQAPAATDGRRSQAGSSARFSITAAVDRSRLVMDSGVIWEQLARNTDHHLDFIEITYPPGSSSTNDERMLRHQGFEYGYLLEGELQVTFGFDVFVLRAGESLGLDSSVPHLFTNIGHVAARGIWFVHHRHD